MTSSNFKLEVLSGPERRRRWSTAEKLAIIHETYEADATVSIVARRHGIQPNQLFAWRKLASQGAGFGNSRTWIPLNPGQRFH